MEKNKINIYLIDDHKIFVRGVSTLLNNESDLQVVGFSFDGQNILDYLGHNSIDLVITDIHLPEVSGIELTRQIKETLPQIKVIGLSMFDKAEVIQELIKAGADGYLIKDIEKSELLHAIHYVMEGNMYYSGAVAEVLLQSMTNKDLLTRREREIIKLIVDEKTNAMIADALFISEHTVESHRKNIFRKTNAKSLVGLVKYAYENKIA
jgi:two-component system nitrate/nitrite response regulator NarL